MRCATVHEMGLTQLIDPAQSLKSRMVNNLRLFVCKFHESVDWKEELSIHD
jgi:hypothetical protein